MFRHRIASFVSAGIRLVAILAVLAIGQQARPAVAADFMYLSLEDETIVRYDVSLGTSALVQASRSVFVGAGQGLSNPNAMVFDKLGNLYAANAFNSTITRYDSSGTYIGGTPFVSGSGLNGPFGLAFDSAGNLYAANQSATTITRYDTSGNRIGTDFVPAGQGLNLPYSLVFDKLGNLYAANYSGNTITRYDSSGTYINGTPYLTLSQGVVGPIGLAFDTAGNLYVGNSNANTITRYDPSGNRIGTFFVAEGQGLDSPFGIAFDTAGNLYAANYADKTISKYNAAGVFQFSWSTGSASPLFLAFVPEPSTYVLGAIATGLMAVIARRRKANRKG